MLLKLVIIFCLGLCLSHGHISTTRYDGYTAQPLSSKLYSFYKQNDLIENCTVEVKACDPNEGRRVDGSCNNLNYPSRGTHFQPMYRLQPAHFHNGSMERKAKSGKPLLSPRAVRLHVLPEGKSNHQLFTGNVPAGFAFEFLDIGSIHDAENILLYTTNCCEKEHMADYDCTPNIIADDDPVHRFTDIRCMNSTRPLTFQYYKCTNDPIPSPIAKATPSHDLSQIYNAYNKGDAAVRSFSNGKLQVEEEENKIWPPSGSHGYCPGNEGTETRCFQNHDNVLPSLILLTTWTVRFHNYIAEQLAAQNPCWDDQKLFEVAMDINIAFYMQVFIYELLTSAIGRDNLVSAGVANSHPGFRNVYNSSLYPMVSLEYSISIRYFHVFQDGIMKQYDDKGRYIKDFPTNNATLRTGFFAKDNNMEKFTQSSFRQPCHGHGSIDPELAHRSFPSAQKSMDAPAGDLNKGRTVGFAPYIHYLRLFHGYEVTSFDDLSKWIPKEKIDVLREVYEDVEDVDLMAALWCEKTIEGGHIINTLAHIIMENIRRSIQSDRYWYESSERPNAYTRAQLLEVRKASLSSMLCLVADGVTEIQPNAFVKISPKNPIVPCSEIPKMDFSVWADPACNSSENQNCESS